MYFHAAVLGGHEHAHVTCDALCLSCSAGLVSQAHHRPGWALHVEVEEGWEEGQEEAGTLVDAEEQADHAGDRGEC